MTKLQVAALHDLYTDLERLGECWTVVLRTVDAALVRDAPLFEITLPGDFRCMVRATDLLRLIDSTINMKRTNVLTEGGEPP